MKIIGKYFYMKNYFFHKEIGSLCKFNTYILTQNGFYVFHNLNIGSVSKSVSGRNSKKGPAKILTGPNKFVILGDKT